MNQDAMRAADTTLLSAASGGYCAIKKGPGNMVLAPIRQETVSGNPVKYGYLPFSEYSYPYLNRAFEVENR